MDLEMVQLIKVFSTNPEESFFKLTKLKLLKEDCSKTLNIPSSQEDAGGGGFLGLAPVLSTGSFVLCTCWKCVFPQP